MRNDISSRIAGEQEFTWNCESLWSRRCKQASNSSVKTISPTIMSVSGISRMLCRCKQGQRGQVSRVGRLAATAAQTVAGQHKQKAARSIAQGWPRGSKRRQSQRVVKTKPRASRNVTERRRLNGWSTYIKDTAMVGRSAVANRTRRHLRISSGRALASRVWLPTQNKCNTTD